MAGKGIDQPTKAIEHINTMIAIQVLEIIGFVQCQHGIP